MYKKIQQAVFENKLNRGFNVTDVGKEILLMTEEFGELCDTYIKDDRSEILDAIGDLECYCFGLCSMFGVEADKIKADRVEYPEKTTSLKDYFPYIGREVGMLAKTFKISNKATVDSINRKEEFLYHTGRLITYCSLMFKQVDADEINVLEGIVKSNLDRTHKGKL